MHARLAAMAAPFSFLVACEALLTIPGSNGKVPGDAGDATSGHDALPGDAIVATDSSDGPRDTGGDGCCGPTCGAPPPSCPSAGGEGIHDCGPTHDQDCCTTICVPSGTFNRQNDVSLRANMSRFALDAYEVTVGRFRKFFEAGYGSTQSFKEPANAGTNPNVPDSGWDPAWNALLETSQGTLSGNLVTYAQPVATWTDHAAGNGSDARPMLGVPWYVAFEFCVWDGGRLPTDAEWNYAAAGGSSQLDYPWGKMPVPDPQHAVFGCSMDPDASPDAACSPSYAGVPGSLAKGNATWHHADMAGNAAEWVLDYVGQDPMTCNGDCAVLTPGDPMNPQRVARGGSLLSPAVDLLTSQRRSYYPGDYNAGVGIRCARDLQ